MATCLKFMQISITLVISSLTVFNVACVFVGTERPHEYSN